MFSGTVAPKASPFDPFGFAQGRLCSGQALSRASAFDHQANHIGGGEPQITQIAQIKRIMYVVLLISQKDYEHIRLFFAFIIR